jgi:hypothetical protein
MFYTKYACKKALLFVFICLLISFIPKILLSIPYPAPEYSNDSKCGTYAPKEIIAKIMDEFSSDTQGRPICQAMAISKNGNFHVHYDTVNTNDSMRHAVPMADLDQNGIPDYVDSVCYYFEYAMNFYLNIGYKSPIASVADGGDGYIDVYLKNIGNSNYIDGALYGWTNPYLELPSSTPNLIKNASFIVIDNDFSIYDSSVVTYQGTKPVKTQTYREFGINGMKITAAHELHHAVQNLYGESTLSTCSMLNEMTSTYMEYRVFPDTYDYEQFVYSLFKEPYIYPFGTGSPRAGYRWAIFGQYLFKYFGDEVLRRMWELHEDYIFGYEALDSALREKNTSLADEWKKFMPWLYYTGTRSQQENYFKHADRYPLFMFYDKEFFSSPSVMFADNLQNYEVRQYRIVFKSESISETNDTLDIMLSNIDTYSASKYQYGIKRPFDLTVADQAGEGFNHLENLDYYFNYLFAQNNIHYYNFINAGVVSTAIGYAYPNPYSASKGGSLHFATPEDVAVGLKANLSIYTPDMVEVYSTELPVVVNNFKRVVELSAAPDDLASGVYIFKVDYKGSQTFGKFAVVR